MKENKVTFTLTETTKTAILTASKGTYLAQARAVWEGYLVDASFRQIASAIREVYATADRKQSCGNEAIQGGLVAARLTATNGESLPEEARIQNIANGMRAAADEHAAKEAARRAEKKEEKKAAEQAAAAAAEQAKTTPMSVQLKAKRNELLAWIEDAQKKVGALNGEIEAAEEAEQKQAAEQAAEQKRRDDEVLASAKAIMAARGVTPETTPLLHALSEVEMESGIEARREARRANKASKIAIPA